MKAGMLKLTLDGTQGDLWVQCEKVTYVREDFSGDGNRTLIGFTSGTELKVTEATSWVRRQLCPPEEH